jgi:hypothetical protein
MSLAEMHFSLTVFRRKPAWQLVQVVADRTHSLQLESQAKHLPEASKVPAGHLSTQTVLTVFRSWGVKQEVQVVAEPLQVLQFSLHRGQEADLASDSQVPSLQTQCPSLSTRSPGQVE